jgi:hypothetical protein
MSPQTDTPSIANCQFPIADYSRQNLIGNRQLKIGNAPIAAFQSECYLKRHE